MNSKSKSENSHRLKVETFEKFMLEDDSGRHSMSFIIELCFNQPIDSERLRLSTTQALFDHPLLSAQVDSKQKFWTTNHYDVCFVEDAEYKDVFGIDLKKENGLRVVLNSRQTDQGEIDSATVAFVFHHACCDGMGALGFVATVSKIYSSGAENSTAETKSRFQDSIKFLAKHRNSYGRNRLLYFLRWPIDLAGMLWTYEMIFNRPTSIRPERPVETGDFNESIQFSFDPETSRSIRQLAKSRSQTVNDLILESAFQSIDRWFARFNPEIENPLIRLMVPVNLRKRTMPSASNMVAMVNLDRTPRKWRSVDRFRKFLRLEMNLIKRLGVGITANRFLQVQRLLLGRLPMLRQNRSLSGDLPSFKPGFDSWCFFRWN